MADQQTYPNILSHRPPRIGIRSTIDGRMGGVRESLEDQMMSLAQAVASLINASRHTFQQFATHTFHGGD